MGAVGEPPNVANFDEFSEQHHHESTKKNTIFNAQFVLVWGNKVQIWYTFWSVTHFAYV